MIMDTRRTIALIDDDRAWLDTLAEFLGDRGYHVHTAQGAASGLALLEKFDAAAAVIDFRMPEMNGLQLLRRLRQRWGKLPVLLLSGDDDPLLQTRALEEGAFAFLSKGTSPGLLLRLLLHTLSNAMDPNGPTAAGLLWRRLLPAVRPSGPWLPALPRRQSGQL
jgi:DNA-binding response OmpR family regulator